MYCGWVVAWVETIVCCVCNCCGCECWWNWNVWWCNGWDWTANVLNSCGNKTRDAATIGCPVIVCVVCIVPTTPALLFDGDAVPTIVLPLLVAFTITTPLFTVNVLMQFFCTSVAILDAAAIGLFAVCRGQFINENGKFLVADSLGRKSKKIVNSLRTASINDIVFFSLYLPLTNKTQTHCLSALAESIQLVDYRRWHWVLVLCVRFATSLLSLCCSPFRSLSIWLYPASAHFQVDGQANKDLPKD